MVLVYRSSSNKKYVRNPNEKSIPSRDNTDDITYSEDYVTIASVLQYMYIYKYMESETWSILLICVYNPIVHVDGDMSFFLDVRITTNN